VIPRFVLHAQHRSGWQKAAIRVGAVLLGFLISAVLIMATGKDPVVVFGTMFSGAFGSKWGFSETLVRTTPLLLCSLGIALASRMQLWNIGAEGQFYMGGLGAAFVALKFSTMPAPVLLPTMAIAGFVLGGLWCLLPGIARAYLGTSETITTLLLNYVALNWVAYLVYGPWKDPKGHNFPLSPTFSESATLPVLTGRVHIGLILALIMAGVFWWVLQNSRWGYEIRVIGESPAAAGYAGMNITRNILLVMFVSGAMAGLGGMMEVSGVLHRLQKDISPGYGYTAIIITYLAQRNPLAMILVAFLFGGLQAGAYSIQTKGVPLATAYMIQGMILFCVLGAELFTQSRLRFVWRKEVA
jgi:simple sugar transport system permease protein